MRSVYNLSISLNLRYILKTCKFVKLLPSLILFGFHDTIRFKKVYELFV